MENTEGRTLKLFNFDKNKCSSNWSMSYDQGRIQNQQSYRSANPEEDHQTLT